MNTLALAHNLSTNIKICNGTDTEFEVHVPDRFIKHALQIALCQRRALQILVCPDLFGHRQGLLVRDGFHLTGAEGFGSCAVVSQVEFSTDKNNGDTRCMVFDLWIPLLIASQLRLMKIVGRRHLKWCYSAFWRVRRGRRTLALTLSKEGGLTIEKHIKKTSVCG